jgi:hypothetical protein
MHMTDSAPNQSPEPIASNEAAESRTGASLSAIGTLANLAILAVQAILWFWISIAVCRIIYQLSLPYYYRYLKGSEVLVLPGSSYSYFGIRPGVFVLILAAVSCGLAWIRRIVKRRSTKNTARV